MSPDLVVLVLIISLGSLLILFPIFAEYRYCCRRLEHSSGTSDVGHRTIAGAYRYVCWVTGTAMIAAAIVLLFRLEWFLS